MRKAVFIFVLMLGISACSSSDETDNPLDGELVGTTWLGTGNDEGESYTFLSNQDFKSILDGEIESGMYTYNGNSGTLKWPNYPAITFSITGTTMTVNDGGPSVYEKN